MPSALYPGTFDPVTFGHLDVLRRALDVFGEVEVAVAVNAEKRSLFSAKERVALLRACVEAEGLAGVTVTTFEGLVAAYAQTRGHHVLVRGLRQVSDFDYEFRMAFANRRLAPDLETVFLMTSEAHALVSSSIVRDVHRWGGDVGLFVPAPVAEALAQKRAA
ncbi:MAG TPA: pantetheine-phosphate adenylyltransferase [Rhodothermales bacterium]|nr:pantetheine-phosphate adenylyltransferase [Rhodothermales bacterium]